MIKGKSCGMDQRRPNIVFIFADQLRASSVSCYGEEDVETPGLETFATEGMTFPVAVASPPVCGPYRGCLMTGMNPLSNGVIVNDVALSQAHPSMGECFSAGGYDTAYIGKWHLDGPDRVSWVPKGERRRGFRYWAAANFEHNYKNSKFYRDEPSAEVWEGYDAEAQIDEAIRYLNSRPDDRPFCLFLSWGPPHNPYRMVPDRYLKRYDPAKIRPRPNCPSAPIDDLWGYYAQITFLDEQFSRFLATLDAMQLSENTVVVFTSDHGDMHGSQGVYKKGWPWDESVRVPFIARWPGNIPAGTRAQFPICTVDIMPTLLGLASLPVPPHVEGIDCSRFLLGHTADLPKSVLLTNPCPTTILDGRGEDMVPTFQGRRMEYRGVRSMKHTYVETIDGPWLLYDNIADPFQLSNLLNKSDHDALQTELADDLRQHLRRIRDEFLPKEAYYKRFGIDVDDFGTLRAVVRNPYPANA